MTYPQLRKIKILCFILPFCLLFFGFFVFSTHSAHASNYFNSGSLVSDNLLTGLTDVGAINSFSVTASISTHIASISVQFSRDELHWFDHSGNAFGEDILSNGANTLTLSALNWNGPVFFYKLNFHHTILTSTPLASSIGVDYTQIAGPTYSYYNEGTLVSKNLLDGLSNVGSITQFSATTAIASGETIMVQFSRDEITWYDHTGTAWNSDSLANGSNTIDLSALNWTGPVFFYKLSYTTADPGISASVSASAVSYSGGSSSAYYNQGTLVSTNLLSGGGTLVGNELFGYNLSSLPAGTTAKIQFSTDGDNWYGSDGTLWDSDTLSAGSHLTDGTAINLSTLAWTGTSFYYKLKFTTIDVGSSPTVSEIALFSPGGAPTPTPTGGATPVPTPSVKVLLKGGKTVIKGGQVIIK